MKNSLPARIALALLHQLAHRNEPLAGDLIEEFQHRQSALWLWAQILLALGLGSFTQHHVPVALNLTPIDPVVAEWLMDRALGRDTKKKINLNGTGVEGVGGLSLMILGFLMSTVVPAVWWFVVGGIVAGIALGVSLAFRRRNHFLVPASHRFLPTLT